MILEVAPLHIKAGQTKAFEAAFSKALPILMSMEGYLSHELQRCLEDGQRYLLLVRWEDYENRLEGFHSSPEHQQWKALLHHFYEPFPEVLHYEKVCRLYG